MTERDPFPVDAPDLWMVSARAFYLAMLEDTKRSLQRLDAPGVDHLERLQADVRAGEVGALDKVRRLCLESEGLCQ